MRRTLLLAVLPAALGVAPAHSNHAGVTCMGVSPLDSRCIRSFTHPGGDVYLQLVTGGNTLSPFYGTVRIEARGSVALRLQECTLTPVVSTCRAVYSGSFSTGETVEVFGSTSGAGWWCGTASPGHVRQCPPPPIP